MGGRTRRMRNVARRGGFPPVESTPKEEVAAPAVKDAPKKTKAPKKTTK